MFLWRLYIVALTALAVPIGGLWLQLWHIGAGLKWVDTNPDTLAIATLSVGVSALLAFLVTNAAVRS